jgi:hypothetical protein
MPKLYHARAPPKRFLTPFLLTRATEKVPDTFSADTFSAVSVSYVSGIGGGELEPLVDSAGRATSGNSFVWDEATQQWAFNLATKPHAAAGTYIVSAAAGNEDYVLSPTCSGTFVRH